MKNLEQIWALQELEMEMQKLRGDKALEDETEVLHQMISGFKKLADSMRPLAETYKKNQTVMEELQHTQSKLEKQIQDAEGILYKGEESNSKTLQALQDEIHVLLEKLGPTTEQIKQMELQRKEAQRHLQTMNQLAEKRKQEIYANKKHLEHNKSRNDEKLMGLEDKIAVLRKTIHKDSLEKYDTLKKRRLPVVVESVNGVCKGCNMQVSMVMSQSIAQSEGDETQTLICENCGRILYIREETTITTE